MMSEKNTITLNQMNKNLRQMYTRFIVFMLLSSWLVVFYYQEFLNISTLSVFDELALYDLSKLMVLNIAHT